MNTRYKHKNTPHEWRVIISGFAFIAMCIAALVITVVNYQNETPQLSNCEHYWQTYHPAGTHDSYIKLCESTYSH